MNAAKKSIKPRLTVIDGLVTTTSLAVAESFENDNVMREIFSMVEFCKENLGEDFHARNFILPDDDFADANSTGQPMCRITRSGFWLWVTHFGGRDQKAMAAAIAYMEAFEMMEKSLSLPTVGNAPAVFNFGDLSVRTLDRNGEIWFVAADVCTALDIDNVSLAINGNPSRKEQGGLDDDEKGVYSVNVRSGNGIEQNRQVVIINESGLYSLIFKSRKAEAKKFKKWVTSEVLPAIRKTGRYEAPSPSQPMDAHSYTNEVAFLRLFYAFDHNLGPAVLLWVLMQMGATSKWVSPTVREIADESSGMISKSNVTRCAVNLKERGLIEMKADLPWSRATYFVLEEAVRTLLEQAGKELAGLPGIQDEGNGPLLRLTNGTVH